MAAFVSSFLPSMAKPTNPLSATCSRPSNKSAVVARMGENKAPVIVIDYEKDAPESWTVGVGMETPTPETLDKAQIFAKSTIKVDKTVLKTASFMGRNVAPVLIFDYPKAFPLNWGVGIRMDTPAPSTVGVDNAVAAYLPESAKPLTPKAETFKAFSLPATWAGETETLSSPKAAALIKSREEKPKKKFITVDEESSKAFSSYAAMVAAERKAALAALSAEKKDLGLDSNWAAPSLAGVKCVEYWN